MAALYRVHRATVARGLRLIRQEPFESVKSHLARPHRLDSREVRSLYRRLQRDVHITLSPVLRASA